MGIVVVIVIIVLVLVMVIAIVIVIACIIARILATHDNLLTKFFAIYSHSSQPYLHKYVHSRVRLHVILRHSTLKIPLIYYTDPYCSSIPDVEVKIPA